MEKNPCAINIFAIPKFSLLPGNTPYKNYWLSETVMSSPLHTPQVGAFTILFHISMFLPDSLAFSSRKKISRIIVALCNVEKKICTFPFAPEHSSPIEEWTALGENEFLVIVNEFLLRAKHACVHLGRSRHTTAHLHCVVGVQKAQAVPKMLSCTRKSYSIFVSKMGDINYFF